MRSPAIAARSLSSPTSPKPTTTWASPCGSKGSWRPPWPVAARRCGLRPDLPEGHNNLGSALEETGRMDEAVACLEEALRLRPDFAKAHNNLAIAYWHQGRLEEAIASCHRAIELMPELSEAHNNLGNVLRDKGMLDEALASYEQAIVIKSDYADPYWNRSLIRLLQGDLTPGWADYEWRWKLASFVVRKTDRPKWDGASLEGRTLLIDTEQGLGDTIQFIRYAQVVRERAGQVIVVCPKTLVRLLSSCAGIDQLLTQGDTLPAFDTHTPLLSLPFILGTTLDNIPAKVPYLTADAELVDAGAARSRRSPVSRSALPGREVPRTAPTVCVRCRWPNSSRWRVRRACVC